MDHIDVLVAIAIVAVICLGVIAWKCYPVLKTCCSKDKQSSSQTVTELLEPIPNGHASRRHSSSGSHLSTNHHNHHLVPPHSKKHRSGSNIDNIKANHLSTKSRHNTLPNILLIDSDLDKKHSGSRKSSTRNSFLDVEAGTATRKLSTHSVAATR